MPTLTPSRQAECLAKGRSRGELQVFARWHPVLLAWTIFLGVPMKGPGTWQWPPKGCRKLVQTYGEAQAEISRFN